MSSGVDVCQQAASVNKDQKISFGGKSNTQEVNAKKELVFFLIFLLFPTHFLPLEVSSHTVALAYALKT